MSFAMINVNLLTGVTLIASIVPASFSATMFKAGKAPQIIISKIPKSEGIINRLLSKCLLYKYKVETR